MSDEYILKQLDNDANVIGYYPNLEYKKDRSNWPIYSQERWKTHETFHG